MDLIESEYKVDSTSCYVGMTIDNTFYLCRDKTCIWFNDINVGDTIYAKLVPGSQTGK